MRAEEVVQEALASSALQASSLAQQMPWPLFLPSPSVPSGVDSREPPDTLCWGSCPAIFVLEEFNCSRLFFFLVFFWCGPFLKSY